MKYWSSLPSGWPDARLPEVTFYVYRYAEEGEKPDTTDPDKAVARLTITSAQWDGLKNGLSYRYLIQYEGANTLSVQTTEGTKTLVCNGPDDEASVPLSRYDEHGKLYTYVVRETVNWGADKPDADEVFEVTNNAFTFTNAYQPAIGTITVKKFLYLPTGADGKLVYPAVTFKLTRQVQDEDGGYVKDETFAEQTEVLSSDKVATLYRELEEGSDGKKAGYITGYVEFTDLPLYAPDGTEYHYTVTEDKSELQGYDTWAQAGNVGNPDKFDSAASGEVAVADLIPEKAADLSEPVEPGEPSEPSEPVAQATFKNQRSDPQERFESFTATKVWDDFRDTFDFRPDPDEFKELLILTRTADSQKDQKNGITETMSKDSYTLDIEDNGNGTWTMKISPAGNATFDKYAPNGMPWKYIL